MTNAILGIKYFIAPVTRFVQQNTQKVLGELNPSIYVTNFMETGWGNSCRRPVAVLLQKKWIFATLA